jgi:tyrosine-protein kinase Etk/Wzc
VSVEVKNNGIMNPGTRHDADEEFVLGDLLRVIAEDVWWLVGAALVVLTLGGLYCVFAKPVYVANALIKIEQANDAAPALMQLSSVASAMTPLPADAEIAIMQSRDVMKDVVKKFKFDITVESKKMPIFGAWCRSWQPQGGPRIHGSV